MQSLRKRIQAQATEVRANLDAAIKEKLDQARTRLEGDTAWSVATRVLEKVRAVRESLQKAAPVKTAAPKSKASKPAAKKSKATGKAKARRSSAKAPKRAH